MRKIIYPPEPRFGQVILRHKTKTQQLDGRTVPVYKTVLKRVLDKLPKDFLSEFEIYREYGQADPNAVRVEKPKLPTHEQDTIQVKERPSLDRNDGEEGMGSTSSGDTKQTGDGLGDKGKSEETDTAESRVESRGGQGNTP